MGAGRLYTRHRRKLTVVLLGVSGLLILLTFRLFWLMIGCSGYYSDLAEELHERERPIKAARGKILDRNGVVLADNRTVCTISVIHSQITDEEAVVDSLSVVLKKDKAEIRKKVQKISSMERIASNVSKETGDAVRKLDLAGVKVDEDYKRTYPYHELASRVLGFTGSDNQGIIGLEVRYDEVMQGKNGNILTLTDAKGVELEGTGERREEPEAGDNLWISLDYNIQSYIEQEALRVLKQKEADTVSIIIMNPQNGEIYGMTTVPEFDLNEPFCLSETETVQETFSEKEIQNLLNQKWRNNCINDTYEPGSTFKIFTASTGLETGAVSLEDTFFCPGYKTVEDRRIRCHKISGHGSETFTEAVQNSCNPVFIETGLRIGKEAFFQYLKKLHVLDKTGIDLPGEAGTIMHKEENVGLVELATMSFGQSFQITPIRLAAMVSSVINGGNRITPHFALASEDPETRTKTVYSWEAGERVLSEETSAVMRSLLENVVAQGSGKRAYLEGWRIGGKTATSETLPRSANIYISSFVGFAPADDPKVLGLCIIDNPKGIYYGGTIAAPVIRRIFENILPYLGIERTETQKVIEE